MLVHYDGSMTKLAGMSPQQEQYKPSQEATNSVQQAIQPVNTSAAPPSPPKNTKPAAGSQTDMSTPRIYNPTLSRMGIQMPEPNDPRQVSTKLSNLREAIGRRQGYSMFDRDADLVQTLKHRDYYDSPYMDSRDQTRLALMAHDPTRKSEYDSNIAGGVGAAAGVLAPLLLKGVNPRSLLASAGLGALGFFGGRELSNVARQTKMREYRAYLEGNPRY